jgi:hypothetical protein
MGNAILKFLQVAKELGLLELIPPFNFGANKLQGVATGTADTDAVIRSQVKSGAIVVEIDGTDTDGDLLENDYGIAKVPYACTIKKATLISRETGATVTVDILAGADMAHLASITGIGTKPALSNAQEVSVTNFTNYGTMALSAGQIVQAKVGASPAVANKAWLLLEVERA